MSKFIGRQASLGIGKESVRGTAVVPTYWVPWMELSADTKVEAVVDETSLARLEDSDAMNIVSKFGEISWKTKLKQTHIGLVLLSLFGTVASVAKSAPNAAVYDHTFSVQQGTQHASLTATIKDSNQDLAYANGVIDSLKLTAEIGNYVMYEASMMSKGHASASTTVAHVQEKDFVPQMLTFKRATTQAGLDGASATVIRNVSIEFKQNVMKEDVLGNVAPNDILNQSFEISGSITLIHNNADFQDLQNNETYNAFRIDLVHPDTIGTSSNPELKIDLHRVRVTNYERKYNLDDMVEESFDFKALYSLTDSKMATVILTNLATAY